MQSIRVKNTAPEQIAEECLRELGYEFEQNAEELPGTPDFYFPKLATVVFVHGCFWHAHATCTKGTKRPKSNQAFWESKLSDNQRRDRRVSRELRSMGLSVYTIWECEVKRIGIPTRLVTHLDARATDASY